ncbi:Aromatic ring-opening dioxygenase, catalytic subunit, LigB family [Collimonas sp. OK607]|uniref:DODA-type extradiol aromatic ring-opening family dioxygenase n=1 Tax=Collimonas sp. OK607 TaxID=1798194 RepID=UPI0008E7D3E0|nr:class III extradiol ring-cleavage dioxygenase [Collimonas sp. OK607]SFB21375.1 Aromatic ring-opening dioxygenase, catalytic subunit, LigB family [Collimonas sp. OK607]
MTSTTLAPVFFISHGAPTFAIEPGVLGPRLHELGEYLPALKAVLVVSPHWQTQGVTVMSSEQPGTVHDFGGFPANLYTLQYPATGQPELAKEAVRLLAAAGFATEFDAHRGRDHGAWIPMMHLLPKANVPVFQVSMPHNLNSLQAVKLGQALAPLRELGVLIVASGSMTHNLFEFRHLGSAPAAYVREFSAWVHTAVLAKATSRIIWYRAEAPHAERAHPTEEHFLPLLVALGAQNDSDTVQAIDGGITHGVLSMDSFVWGMPQPAAVSAAP